MCRTVTPPLGFVGTNATGKFALLIDVNYSASRVLVVQTSFWDLEGISWIARRGGRIPEAAKMQRNFSVDDILGTFWKLDTQGDA